MKSQRNDFLQTFELSLREGIGLLLLVVIAPCPCKLLEHIVCSNITAHLDEYQLLSDRHRVFRKRHSCETKLTTVMNDWVKILDKDIDSEITRFAADCLLS